MNQTYTPFTRSPRKCSYFTHTTVHVHQLIPMNEYLGACIDLHTRGMELLQYCIILYNYRQRTLQTSVMYLFSLYSTPDNT